MNSATLRAPRPSKRLLLSDPSIRASLLIDATRHVVLSDDLRQRWEQIVSKGRS